MTNYNSDIENLLYTILSSLGIGISILTPILMVLVIFLFVFAIFLVTFIVLGIPLYKMAKNAGYKYPIFAFLPVMSTYLWVILSKEEFNLFNWIIIKDRKKAAWISVLVLHAPIIIFTISSVIAAVPFVGWIIASLLYMLISVFSIVIYIFNWRIYYDLFTTYEMGENTLLYSILSLFIPIMGIVMLYIIMNKEPNYGFNNFYAEKNKEINTL